MANAWIIKPVLSAAISASSVQVGAAANVLNDYAGIVWRSNLESIPYLLIDLGADWDFDTIMLFGVGGVPISTGQIRVRLATAVQGSGFNGSATDTGIGAGAFWEDEPRPLYAGSIMPVSGSGVSLWAKPSGPPAFNRYVLLHLFRGDGGDAEAQVSRLVIGKRIQLERNFSFGGAFGVRDLGSLDFNRRGVMSRIRGKKLRTVGLTFSNINKDEVEATTKPLLEQIGNTEMIALVTDPVADAHRQNRCYFGPLVGDLAHTWRNAKAWEAKLNQVSIF